MKDAVTHYVGYLKLLLRNIKPLDPCIIKGVKRYFFYNILTRADKNIPLKKFNFMVLVNLILGIVICWTVKWYFYKLERYVSDVTDFQ